jgi:hypothetical protein
MLVTILFSIVFAASGFGLILPLVALYSVMCQGIAAVPAVCRARRRQTRAR